MFEIILIGGIALALYAVAVEMRELNKTASAPPADPFRVRKPLRLDLRPTRRNLDSAPDIRLRARQKDAGDPARHVPGNSKPIGRECEDESGRIIELDG